MSQPVIRLCLILILCCYNPLAAQQPALTQTITARDLDARIDNHLYEVSRLATDIYNRGSHEASFRLYQGSLMSLLGFLQHRPEYVEKIQQTLRSTDSMTNAAERARALREVIDELRQDIRLTYTANPPAITKPIKPAENAIPLWTRLGGEEAIKPIVNEWINRAMVNPRVNFTRRGSGREWEANPENVSKVKAQFLAMLSSKMGGPLPYTGRDMKTVHEGMKITEPEFQALMDDFTAALDKFFVSPFERKELMQILLETKKDIVDTSVVVKPLWERLGGEATITLVLDDFLTRTLKNPKVNFSRKDQGQEWAGNPDQISNLKKQLLAMISQATGGPYNYTGKSMEDAHKGMKIREAEFE
ncbi:MAG TPA: group 1 truncated hemoglobin, partial [Gemmatales bacterium]|nr:group 1 truncated hemoglobin [Gemmatales bacterium]